MIISFIAITVVLITKNRLKEALNVWCSGVFDPKYVGAKVLKKVSLLNSKDLAT